MERFAKDDRSCTPEAKQFSADWRRSVPTNAVEAVMPASSLPASHNLFAFIYLVSLSRLVRSLPVRISST
jgi:hypothetical protein